MNILGNQNFVWWTGVVEDRSDPEMLGRCKVRIFGYNTDNTAVLNKDDLPWAIPLQPITSAATSGIGQAPVGPVEGTWVVGWYLDGEEKQQPLMVGTIAGITDNSIAAKKGQQDIVTSGGALLTSAGNPVTDSSGNVILTSSYTADDANALPSYERTAAILNNPGNPKADPTGALNDPSLAAIKGFQDPNKVYPTLEYNKLPDTNKLATGNLSHKYFKTKKYHRKTGIKTASGSKTWDEPGPAFGASYPNNQVIETEAGHVIELDNTPSAERIHIYHKKGSYIEIDVNGSTVKKTIGDSYEITDRNGYVYVKGAYNLTVSGTTKILVQNSADIEVAGDLTATCHGDTLVQSAKNIGLVGDTIVVSAKSGLDLISDGPVNIQGSTIAVNAKAGSFSAKASKDLALQSGASSKASIKGGLEVLIDAAVIKQKMGAISVPGAKLPVSTPPEAQTPVASTFGDLTRPATSPSTFIFDGLEAGSDANRARRIASGEIIDKKLSATATDTGAGNSLTGLPIDCAEFANYSTFPDTIRLSNHYNLGHLSTRTAAGSHSIQAQHGLSKAQIACNLKGLAVNVLDKIRDKYSDMIITSAFRPGNSTSDHELGAAADLQFKSHSFADYYDIVKWIRDNVPFKQLLLEYETRPSGTIAWIHIAYRENQKSAMRVGTLVNHGMYLREGFANLA